MLVYFRSGLYDDVVIGNWTNYHEHKDNMYFLQYNTLAATDIMDHEGLCQIIKTI